MAEYKGSDLEYITCYHPLYKYVELKFVPPYVLGF